MTNKQNVKKKKRKVSPVFKFAATVTIVFITFGVIYLGTCIGLKSYNVSLDMQKQQIQEQIATVRSENATLSYEVKNLSDYDRIMNIVGNEMRADDGVVYTVSE